jgi:hypothetical protein
MALQPIHPLSYKQFVEILGDIVTSMTALLENHPFGDWWNALQRYQFNGMNYITGQNVRHQFHQQIVQALDLNQKIIVANQILEWGQMQPLSAEMEENLEGCLELLNNVNAGPFDQLYSDRIASISKVYEMWNPAAWVIFDSYCARGLQWLVSEFWNEQGGEIHANILRFPWPPGRVGQPWSGFPRLGSLQQARLGFLYSSWLCRAIANQLNQYEHQPITWQAYHIEMVAFQIGHEV